MKTFRPGQKVWVMDPDTQESIQMKIGATMGPYIEVYHAKNQMAWFALPKELFRTEAACLAGAKRKG